MRESTYFELRAKLAALDEQIQHARVVERAAAIERIYELMREYNISAQNSCPDGAGDRLCHRVIEIL